MNFISEANQHQYSAAPADSTPDRGGSSAAPANSTQDSLSGSSATPASSTQDSLSGSSAATANSTQDRSCCSAAPANSTQDRSGFSAAPANSKQDRGGSSAAPANSTQDRGGSSAALADSTQDRGGSSAAPANSKQDRGGSSAAPANSTQDRGGSSAALANSTQDRGGSSAAPANSKQDRGGSSAAPASSTQDSLSGSSAATANSTQDRSRCSAAPANSTHDRSGFSLKKTVVPSSADRVNPSVNIHPPTTHLNYYGIPIIAGEWKKYYECRIQNVWRSNIFVCAGSGGEIKTTPILHTEGNKNVFKCNIFGGVRPGTCRAVYLGVFRTFAKEYIATSSDSKLILMKSKPLNRTIRKIEHPDSRYFYIYKTHNGNYCFESMLHNGWFWRVDGNIGLVLECNKEELVEKREDMQFTIINSKSSLGQG